MTLKYNTFQSIADIIRHQTNHHPTIGMILGSGMGPLADEIESPTFIPYNTIPDFPKSHVKGHEGRLVIGKLQGKTVLVMQGRVHFYEGYSIQTVTMPVRVMQVLGLKTLIVTNAAGGINTSFRAGDLMLITDHINILGMTGTNPLIGPNFAEFGTRFPDMTSPYNLELQQKARQVAKEAGIKLHEGVYACLSGPSFETPAEIRFLKTIGADAVGMSTAPEVVVARHGGMKVLGISGISNVVVSQPTEVSATTHEEVLEASKVIAPKLITIVKGVLGQLPTEPNRIDGLA
ncbi:MAG: purine-nucleoside phosphorylase [Anaerolineaceae bacterium 4572_78]|nr:MAG: purine-nucleoside phosphorylase [Anaerolineaceae bacterium 4572_78]